METKLSVRHIDLQQVIEFLEDISFKGIKSIEKTKIVVALTEKMQEVYEGEKSIREDYKNDMDVLESELKEYFETRATIEGGEYIKGLEIIKKQVEEYLNEDSEVEFKGSKARVLYLLYVEFNLGEEQ